MLGYKWLDFLLTLILRRSWEDLAIITAFIFSVFPLCYLFLSYFIYFFETESHYVTQANLEVTFNPH